MILLTKSTQEHRIIMVHIVFLFIMYYNFIGGVVQAHENAVDKYSNGKLPYLCVINTVHDYTIILSHWLLYGIPNVDIDKRVGNSIIDDINTVSGKIVITNIF